VGFVSFPITGIAAQAAAGRINDAVAALAGGLALMGAITEVPLGTVQAFLLRDRVARSWVRAAAMPLLWALGWTVTAAAGVGLDRQYAVFGAFGAITFMALSGVVLDRLRAATPPHHPRSTARQPRPPSNHHRCCGWHLPAEEH